MNWKQVRELDSAEKRWPKTEYVVEATHEEMFQLWQETHTRFKWEQCHGWLITLGTVVIGPDVTNVETMPVTVSVTWQLLDGHLVAFYEAASQVVDYRMVDKYVRENCAKHTDAANFHHCVHDLELGSAPVKRSTPPR